MNKTKKIAIAAVSLAMAGTLAFGVFGCNGGNGGGGNSGGGGGGGISSSVDLSGFGDVDNIGTGAGQSVVATNTDCSINYDSYTAGRSKVTLNMACGHNNDITSMTFKTVSNTITLPDGNAYQNGDLKPAWEQVGKDLNLGFNDVYLGKATNANLKSIIEAAAGSPQQYDNVDVFTSDLSYIVEYAAKGYDILNLGDYLDLMPHFKKFLEENPVVYLSLLQAGMDSNGNGKTLYVAPYFDGYDDIERYFLIREDWAKKVLNGDTQLDTTIPTNANTTIAVEAEFTENYTIKSMNAAGTAFQNITKDYGAAKTAVNGSGALHDAFVAIAGASATFEGDDGNIVTIMNEAMTKGAANATADKLADLYRAYIDVAYKVGSNAAYTAATRANLFNGYDAAWDVDDLVAILRIMTRAPQALLGSQTGTVQGIVSRENNNDRSPDVLRLITALYGVRGADSRYEYSYIDNDNVYQDARLDEEFYEAILKGNKLYQEGLVQANYYNTNGANYKGAWNSKGSAEGFMLYDYVQTQTGVSGFDAEIAELESKTVDAWSQNYYLGTIINPVAKWSVSTKDDTIMRFTESWRSTKTGGIGLNGKLANDPDKLLAALQFIDYIYSADGQIVTTFGPMAEDADSTNGFWYNEEATTAEINAGKYFTYKGVKYSGTDYKGEITPTVTDDMYKSFLGLKTKEGASETAVGLVNLATSGTTTCAKSFTNYARMLIGSTLPMCVKSQSFEYQCTAEMGRESAYIVGVAIDMGILNHVTPQIKVAADGSLKAVVQVKDSFEATQKTSKELSPWYIMVPSGLPVDSNDQATILDSTNQTNFKQCTGTKPSAVDKSVYWSFFHTMISDGFNVNYNITNVGSINLTNFKNEEDPVAALVNHLKTAQWGNAREEILQESWQTAVAYCSVLFK